MAATAVTQIDLEQYGLKKIASGKVREIYEIDSTTLLFVATDRISAYDVILTNGIPGKGALLTQLSGMWFDLIQTKLPDLKTHLISLDLPATLSVPDGAKAQLKGRSMLVRRYEILPIEAIVRGYITGSAWSEYTKSGTVNGMPLPQGLRESQKLQQAIWTPSTKAEAGAHDENISKERAAEIIGADRAEKVEEISLRLYELARAYAEERGIIIADTKFEFGWDAESKEVVLVDEVLTPDSSRFWPKDEYAVGKGQNSFDKQYLRDWLTKEGLKGKEGVSMPQEVVEGTKRKYAEAYEKLTGKRWD